jgi:hypothetical protein
MAYTRKSTNRADLDAEVRGPRPSRGNAQAGPENVRTILSLQARAGNDAVVQLLAAAAPAKAAPAMAAPAAGSAPAYQAPKNPSYLEASNYVTRYFVALGWVQELEARMSDDGFSLFKSYTHEDPDKTGEVVMAIFFLALAAVPEAAPFLIAFNELKDGQRAYKLINELSHLAHKLEPLDKVADTGKALKEHAEAQEAKEAAEFELETINDLSQLSVDFVKRRLERMSIASRKLDALRDSASSINLLAEVSSALGPIPDASGLEDTMRLVRDQFELGLYKHFYVDSGRAYHRYDWPGGWGPYDKGLQGVPNKVEKRVAQLGGSRMFDNVRREDRMTSSGMGAK